jgi:hypothetical protein
MKTSRHFDVVAFDVRDDASMLFFARTTGSGDIADYLLIMRAEGETLGDTVYLEMNERQLAGHDLVKQAHMTDNVLTLDLREPAEELDGAHTIALSFDGTRENRSNMEAGAFRVLGNLLEGGHA